MVHDRALFLSLQPQYAAMILDGNKTVELRRIRPKADVGTPVIAYATSPVRSVVGTCEVGSVVGAKPDEIWELHGHSTGIDRARFDEYFLGSETAVAITVVHPVKFATPVLLAELRLNWVGFQPPQSFRYISLEDFEVISRAGSPVPHPTPGRIDVVRHGVRPLVAVVSHC